MIDHLLLGFYNDTSLRGMKYLFNQSLKSGYKPILVILKSQSNKVKDIDKSKVVFINLSIIRIFTILNLFKLDTFLFFKNYFFNNTKNTFYYEFKKFLWKKKFKISCEFYKSILIQHKPKLIYTCGDRTRNIEPIFLKLAKLYDIPTVVTPISYCLSNENLLWKYRTKALRKFNDFKKKNVTNLKSFRRNFRGQIIFDENTKKYISFFEPWLTEAMREEGVLSENPWQIGLGLCSYVCVNGQKDYNRFIKNKVPANKIKITGSIDFDPLYQIFIQRNNIRKRFCIENNISQNKDILIFSIPQFREHGFLDNKSNWKLINKICESLSKINCNTFISLHPKSKKNEYMFLENKYHIKILSENLNQILPIADIFVVGLGSSTLFWSVLCEVPLILLDPLKLDNSSLKYSEMYDGIEGIKIINNMNNLPKSVKEIQENTEENKNIKKKFKRQKDSIGLFDGKSIERVLNINNFD